MKLAPFRICRVVMTVTACALTTMAQGTQTKQNASEYYAHADLHDGASVGADFLGKYMPIQGTTIYSDEYMFVEVALFPAPGHRVSVKEGEFKLKINGTELPVQPPGEVRSTQAVLEMVPRRELLLGSGPSDGTLEIGGGRGSLASRIITRKKMEAHAQPICRLRITATSIRQKHPKIRQPPSAPLFCTGESTGSLFPAICVLASKGK